MPAGCREGLFFFKNRNTTVFSCRLKESQGACWRRSALLRVGRRLSGFHCVASGPRISPKMLTAVLVLGLECCLALQPRGFVASGGFQQLLCRSCWVLGLYSLSVMGGGRGGGQGQPGDCSVGFGGVWRDGKAEAGGGCVSLTSSGVQSPLAPSLPSPLLTLIAASLPALDIGAAVP